MQWLLSCPLVNFHTFFVRFYNNGRLWIMMNERFHISHSHAFPSAVLFQIPRPVQLIFQERERVGRYFLGWSVIAIVCDHVGDEFPARFSKKERRKLFKFSNAIESTQQDSCLSCRVYFSLPVSNAILRDLNIFKKTLHRYAFSSYILARVVASSHTNQSLFP